MESISTFFKEENDSLFYRGEVKGREEGREEEQEKFITYLLEKLGLSDEQAAGIVGVRLELVQKTREKLKK